MICKQNDLQSFHRIIEIHVSMRMRIFVRAAHRVAEGSRLHGYTEHDANNLTVCTSANPGSDITSGMSHADSFVENVKVSRA